MGEAQFTGILQLAVKLSQKKQSVFCVCIITILSCKHILTPIRFFQKDSDCKCMSVFGTPPAGCEHAVAVHKSATRW